MLIFAIILFICCWVLKHRLEILVIILDRIELLLPYTIEKFMSNTDSGGNFLLKFNMLAEKNWGSQPDFLRNFIIC